MLNKKALAASVSAGPAKYVEDVFSTYLYTGNGTFSGETQAISNGIDLAGEGGMVWIKNRTSASTDNCVSDTVRGGTSNMIRTNSTATATGSGSNISFQSTGFTCLTSGTNTNYTGENYCSWTFRKTKKFFDIVTWTGTGSAMTINHNLGSAPGMIIMKKVNGSPGTGNWAVWHRGLPTESGSQQYESNVLLNLTDANVAYGYLTATPTSSSFSVSSSFGQASDYVAYLFAHDAGGFGTAGTDNVISCGSVVGAGNPTEVNLGYEPQFLLIKNASSAQDWWLVDNMRGLVVENASASARLNANTSGAEITLNVRPTATGFISGSMSSGATYIYMAIRRPMKVPTTGTSVFAPVAFTGDGSANTGQFITAGFPVDLGIQSFRNQGYGAQFADRLRGFTGPSNSQILYSYSTAAEAVTSDLFRGDSNTGIRNYGHSTSLTLINWLFRRAPNFFDVVCYTGTGSATTFNHNLGVAPELIIFKGRSLSINWFVYGNITASDFSRLILNQTGSGITYGYADGAGLTAQPTSSLLNLGSASATNGSGNTYVAYLFATLAGVSKVGSYTGTGATQTINCGFTAGARFVLIKRTDSTGDWYVWDTARGIVSGNDPYLLLNSTAAEVTSTDYIDPVSSGFEISSTAPAAINANGGSFIFMAIA